MRHIFIGMLLIFMVSTFGCTMKENKTKQYNITEYEEKSDFFPEELLPYEDIIIKDFGRKRCCYAFVRVAGSDQPVLLLSKDYFEVKTEESNDTVIVSEKADAYILKNKKACKLGTLQCGGPTFSLAIDQEGYVYETYLEGVYKGHIDDKEKKLEIIEAAYQKEGRNLYWNMENGEIEVENESALQTMFNAYSEACAIRFIPIIWKTD